MSETNGNGQVPIENGSNGRNGKGQFAKGNPGGPGNPAVTRATAFTLAMQRAVTEEDIRRAARALVEAAIDGDVQAIKLLFDRTMGPVTDKMHLSGDVGTGRIVVMLPPRKELTS